MSADGICVGNDPASERSKALRRAFATIFTYYRDVTIAEYCGAHATVTDQLVRADAVEQDDAYSYTVDSNGNEILAGREDILHAEEAVLDAARGFLRQAGYTLVNGQVTAVPAGAKRTFHIYLVGDEQGRNPCYQLMVSAKGALEKLGLSLSIHDYARDEELHQVLRSETAEMWCGVWQDGYNPDTYSLYHSQGGMQYLFDVRDTELDKCITAARRANSETERQKNYERCYEIVKDLTVEIPLYRQKTALVYRVDSVEVNTITQDVTPHYAWTRDIAETELKKKVSE